MTILTRLKTETRPWHDQVERAVDLPARLASIQAYAGLLARFYGLYEPLEAALVRDMGSEVAGVPLGPRLKSHLIAADLAALCWTPAVIQRLPRCGDLPATDTVERALGCMYVLEGATLGGQIIRKAMATRLPCAATTFFSPYGDQLGEKWHSFCQAVLDWAKTDGIQDTIVQSAIETFRRVEAWISVGTGPDDAPGLDRQAPQSNELRQGADPRP